LHPAQRDNALPLEINQDHQFVVKTYHDAMDLFRLRGEAEKATDLEKMTSSREVVVAVHAAVRKVAGEHPNPLLRQMLAERTNNMTNGLGRDTEISALIDSECTMSAKHKSVKILKILLKHIDRIGNETLRKQQKERLEAALQPSLE